MTLAVGGFGLCGIPEALIEAPLRDTQKKDLTVISNNAGVDRFWARACCSNPARIRKMVCPMWGETKEFERHVNLVGRVGSLEIHAFRAPCGKSLRAGGAGFPAFSIPRTGYRQRLIARRQGNPPV